MNIIYSVYSQAPPHCSYFSSISVIPSLSFMSSLSHIHVILLFDFLLLIRHNCMVLG